MSDAKTTTLADLWHPVPPDKIKQKPGGPKRPPVDYVEWPVVWARILDCDPLASWEVVSVTVSDGMVVVHGRLSITDPETGTVVVRDSIGDASVREDGATSAEAQALKRCGSKFGIGIGLYDAALDFADTPLGKATPSPRDDMSAKEETSQPAPASPEPEGVSEAVRRVYTTESQRTAEDDPAEELPALLTRSQIFTVGEAMGGMDASPEGDEERRRVAGKIRSVYSASRAMVATRVSDLLQASMSEDALSSILGMRSGTMTSPAIMLLANLCATDDVWGSEEFQAETHTLWVDYRAVRRVS